MPTLSSSHSSSSPELAVPARPVRSTAWAIKLDAERLRVLIADEGAWHRAAGVADRADRWVWTRPGAQLGRLSAAHRAADPVAVAPDLLDEAPRDPTEREQFGLGVDGSVLVRRDWSCAGAMRLATYVRDGDDLTIHRWDPSGRPEGIELVRALADGRIVHAVDLTTDGDCLAERYDWDPSTGALRSVELLAVSASARLAARRVRVTDRFVYPAQ